MKFLLIFLAICVSACTFKLTQVHTEGTASDLMDDTLTPKIDVDTQVPPIEWIS